MKWDSYLKLPSFVLALLYTNRISQPYQWFNMVQQFMIFHGHFGMQPGKPRPSTSKSGCTLMQTPPKIDIPKISKEFMKGESSPSNHIHSRSRASEIPTPQKIPFFVSLKNPMDAPLNIVEYHDVMMQTMGMFWASKTFKSPEIPHDIPGDQTRHPRFWAKKITTDRQRPEVSMAFNA